MNQRGEIIQGICERLDGCVKTTGRYNSQEEDFRGETNRTNAVAFPAAFIQLVGNSDEGYKNMVREYEGLYTIIIHLFATNYKANTDKSEHAFSDLELIDVIAEKLCDFKPPHTSEFVFKREDLDEQMTNIIHHKIEYEANVCFTKRTPQKPTQVKEMPLEVKITEPCPAPEQPKPGIIKIRRE